MSDFNFDDFVKKQLSDQNAAVPPHVIENIIAERKKSDPKGFGMLLSGKNLLVATALLILIVTGYFIFNKDASVNKPVKSPALSEIEKTNDKTNITIGDKSVGKTENGTSIKTDNVANNKTADPFQQDEIKSTPSSQSVDDNVTKTKNRTSASSSVKNKITNSKPFDNNIVGANNTTTTDPSSNKNDDPSYKNKNAVSIITTKEDNDFYYNRIVPFTFANTKELLSTKKLTSKYDFPSCPTIEKNAAGNKKYYEVYAGPDHAIGSYKTAVPDSSTNNYLQKRKETSKISSAYSAGIRYTKVFNNAMSVRTGVNYSQINEKFKYVNTNELKQVTVITTRIIIRSPGDTLFIKDTLQYLQSGTRIKTTYNRYHTIDIPLVLGYELGNGRLHANINAGIIINVYSWYKGDVLDTSYQPVSITSGKNSQYGFKNNIGVGFLGGVSVYYKLNDNVHLLLEPYFRYNLSPMSKENLNLQQKYHTAGIRAGLRFDLK